MSTKRRSSKDQTITVSEFKQWLSGVEDMQPTGWVPNEEQWKKIRAKIASLSEDVFEEIVQPAPAPQPVYHQPVPAYAPPHPTYVPMQPQRQPQTSLGDELFIPKPDATDIAFDQSMSTPGVTQYS